MTREQYARELDDVAKKSLDSLPTLEERAGAAPNAGARAAMARVIAAHREMAAAYSGLAAYIRFDASLELKTR